MRIRLGYLFILLEIINLKSFEYSPFPIVEFPITSDKKWKWELAFGKNWENKDLNVFANDTIHFRYELSSNTNIYNFQNSQLTYSEIRAYSTDSKFRSEFLGYFNGIYGFIYCEFHNIDNSVIKLELIDVTTYDQIKNSDSVYNKLIGNF